MRHGFIKTAAVTPLVKIADCSFNADRIIELVEKASNEDVHLLVFPQLCVTGSTCQDLFFQNTLLEEAKSEASRIAAKVPRNMVAIFGLPFNYSGRLFNCAAVCSDSKVLGLVPQTKPVGAFARYFTCAPEENFFVDFADSQVLFGINQIFRCASLPDFTVACNFGSDGFEPLAGEVSVVAVLDSAESLPGRCDSLKSLLCEKSKLNLCSYVYSSAGEGESTTDCVFTGENAVVENGEVLAFSTRKEGKILSSEVDVQKLATLRRKNRISDTLESAYCDYVDFGIEVGETQLTRHISKTPFFPEDEDLLEKRCSEALKLQALGLKHRMEHTYSKTAVLGLSGGLDSTLALIVTVLAFDMMGRSRSDIICVTLPCFGTTDKTKNNAVTLANVLGCALKTVDIGRAVSVHFEDIGHSQDVFDTTFENAQARERTQVLMDIANMNGGLVIGTGDLSELALGWATYNGDHMAMYGVNASVPKTLVRKLVKHYADASDNEVLIETLYSILGTPISPELIPGGAQATEDLVGPYELHDFFIYHMIVNGSSPSKILRLAKYSFGSEYSEDTIIKWLKTYCRRFFAQQFKRSCLPDGPKVTEVSLSPRGSWAMPSDAQVAAWNRELDRSLL